MTRVAIIGAGVIGKGWTAQLLAHGHHVAIHDPHTSRDGIAEYVAAAAPAMLSLHPGASLDGWESRLEVAASLDAALEGVSWVQENGPESWDVKSTVLAAIDQRLEEDVLIASSTSGVMPTQLASACPRGPQRVLVGHPFNPVQLIPLVEVVGGDETTSDAIAEALNFYRAIGKRPVHVRHEVPGHVANRLQAALWQEAYSLVQRGVASVADVDAAIANGPGLRWALLGPLANQHLSGGTGGLRHILEHLGPPTQAWMDDLRSVRLDDDLTELLVAGVDDELSGIDPADLVDQRDHLLVELLRSKSDAGALP